VTYAAPRLTPLAAAQGRDLVVGIADAKVSNDPSRRLVTYALGSCLGLAVHDPVAGVGGLLHIMLPLSSLDDAKARENPRMFVDTGVPLLFRECYALGARKERMVVKVAGGSFSGDSEAEDRFQIGKRNMLTLRKLLWKNGVLLKGDDVGGCRLSRTMALDVATGAVTLKVNGEERAL
jgi:chemotaxis protein CheD